jgi:ABC-type phosphate transport system substrate-binding protein
MILIVTKARYIFVLLVLAIITAGTSACSINGASASNEVKISATDDIASPMSRLITPAFTAQTGVPVDVQSSQNAIAELKAGKTDAVILGREPTAQESSGLNDSVIAYDAVCIIIDSNTFQGGQFPLTGTPQHKTTPFNNLSLEDLKGIFSYQLVTFGQRWLWQNYYTYKSPVDLEHPAAVATPTWVPDVKAVHCSIFLTPGKYDSQTLLYQALGLDENAVAKAWDFSYTDTTLSAEEEILSVEYQGDSPYSPGSGDFPFKLEYTSRRVIPVAEQHVSISVISINDIDPMQNTQAIYDGQYPFSRKIHILTRPNCTLATSKFVNFLLSPDGQKVLTSANYLPILGN